MLLFPDLTAAHTALVAGDITCPTPRCSGHIAPWGHAPARWVRLSIDRVITICHRRGRCATCRRTHVLSDLVTHPHPALIFWMTLIVQYGLWFHARQVAGAAAAEATDAAQTPAGTAEDGRAAAQSFLDQSGNLDSLVIDVDRGAETVFVEITGTAPQLVPGITWTVTARAESPVERFVTTAADR